MSPSCRTDSYCFLSGFSLQPGLCVASVVRVCHLMAFLILATSAFPIRRAPDMRYSYSTFIKVSFWAHFSVPILTHGEGFYFCACCWACSLMRTLLPKALFGSAQRHSIASGFRLKSQPCLCHRVSEEKAAGRETCRFTVREGLQPARPSKYLVAYQAW